MSQIQRFKKLIDPTSLKEKDLTGKKIVLTGGVFDLLKPFHIDLIEFSRKRGDILVVAVREKGIYTPFIERIEILNEIENIDYLLNYNDQSIEEILQNSFNEVIINKEFDPSGVITVNNGKILNFPD